MSKNQRRSQADIILSALQAGWPSWVPSLTLSRLSLQYQARVFELRKAGWEIQNRVRTMADGSKRGEYRLGSKGLGVDRLPRPVITPTAPTQADHCEGSLFGDITPDRSYRE